jgi:hypothetical protein
MTETTKRIVRIIECNDDSTCWLVIFLKMSDGSPDPYIPDVISCKIYSEEEYADEFGEFPRDDIEDE